MIETRPFTHSDRPKALACSSFAHRPTPWGWLVAGTELEPSPRMITAQRLVYRAVVLAEAVCSGIPGYGADWVGSDAPIRLRPGAGQARVMRGWR